MLTQLSCRFWMHRWGGNRVHSCHLRSFVCCYQADGSWIQTWQPWIPSGTTGTGARWLGWVSLLVYDITWPFDSHCWFTTSLWSSSLHSQLVPSTFITTPTPPPLNLGSSLYSKLINAELESHESKSNFDHFTLSQGDCVVEWECMVVAWEADHSKPDPYIVAKSGKCIFLHNLYHAN